MANPTTLERLDANQVLQAVYDDNLQALRTNVEATVVASGAQEVEVSASSGDNIAIADQTGANFASVSAAGAIRVDTTIDGGATAANQVAELGALISIDSKLPDLNTTPIKTIQLFTKPFDSITASYPTTTQEVYQSRVGGVSGAIQETLTLNYTDATKVYLQDIART